MNRAALAATVILALTPVSAPAAAVHHEGRASTYTATSPLAPAVIAQEPSPGARLRTFFPEFSATIRTQTSAPLRRGSLHFFVDGTDVTQSSTFSANVVSYMPRRHIAPGWHDVFIEGADTAGREFSDAWVFESLAPDWDDAEAAPQFGFIPVGNPDFGGFMHFVLISPDDGFARLQLCGLPEFSFIHVRLSPVFFVTIPVNTFGGFSPFFDCDAGAFFTPFDDFNPVFIPVRMNIAGPGVAPNIPTQPSTSTPRYTQPVYRRGEQPAVALPRTNGATPVYRAPQIPAANIPRANIPRPNIPRTIEPVTRDAPQPRASSRP